MTNGSLLMTNETRGEGGEDRRRGGVLEKRKEAVHFLNKKFIFYLKKRNVKKRIFFIHCFPEENSDLSYDKLFFFLIN